MKCKKIIATAVAAVLGLGPAAWAHEDHSKHMEQMQGASRAPGTVQVRLADAALVTQDGKSVNFKSDVVGGHIVIMDFVYTTCTTVCPVVSGIFAQLQDRLGDRLGKDVRLVSVTVDPVRDTPQRLKAYAAKVNAGPHWTWLTGPTTTVNQVLQGLGTYTPDFTQHPSVVLVGDGTTGKWTRFYGFPDPDQILARINELVQARGAHAGHGHKG